MHTTRSKQLAESVRTSTTRRGLGVGALGRWTRRPIAWLLAVALLVIGCNRFDPSQWDATQMAQEAKSQWKLTEVTLNPVSGGFEGEGKDATGEGYKIKITTDPATKSASGVATGNRGTELTFSVKPK